MPGMPYGLDEHRHRFAAWAAARAAQRGFTSVGHLRNALESTSIRTVLASADAYSADEAVFAGWHRDWCATICQHLAGQGNANVTYGRAAKLIAIYLKAMVLMGTGATTPLGRVMHPPIDRILLQALAASPRVVSPHKAAWRTTSWTQLDEAAYYTLIGQLRTALPASEPFWALEEYWQPSEAADEV